MFGKHLINPESIKTVASVNFNCLGLGLSLFQCGTSLFKLCVFVCGVAKVDRNSLQNCFQVYFELESMNPLSIMKFCLAAELFKYENANDEKL